MAKVSGPLFSVDARGKIADSIIFGGWRGIKTVRRYTVPSNPQTAAQSTSRGFFASGVGLYHTLSSADKAALRVAASGQPYSGFNMFVSGVKSALDQGLDWVTISGVSAAPGSVVISGEASADVQLKISYGLTTALTEGEVFTTPVEGTFSESFPAPLNFEKLHYRVEVDAPGYVGFSGIYPFSASEGGGNGEGEPNGGGDPDPGEEFDHLEFGVSHAELLLAVGSDADGLIVYKATSDQTTYAKTDDWHHTGTSGTAAHSAQFSPDGKYLAVIYDAGLDGKGFALLDSSDMDDITLFASEDFDPLPTKLYWSPCGLYIAMHYAASTTFEVYRISDQGALDLITDYEAPGNVNSLDWSHDSDYIAVGHATSPYFTLLDFTDHTTLTSADTETLAGTCNVVKFSPDGTHVACGHAGNPGLTVLPVSAGGVIGTAFQPAHDYLLTHLCWIPGSDLAIFGCVSGTGHIPLYEVDLVAGSVARYDMVSSGHTGLRDMGAPAVNSIAAAGLARTFGGDDIFAHIYTASMLDDIEDGAMMPVAKFCVDEWCDHRELTTVGNFVTWFGSKA